MDKAEWDKLDPRVQKNLLDAYHASILNTYDGKIREALKLGVEKAKVDGRKQTDIAVVVIAKGDGVIDGLPAEHKNQMTLDYNIIWGYRDELAKMSPWGNESHTYYPMMLKLEEEEPVTEPDEISVWAAVFAFDVGTVRRLHFTPKKISMKQK